MQAHTTNEQHRLYNKRPTSVQVCGHYGDLTTAEYEGDIYLPHNGNTVRISNVLYYTQFSNLVSGLKVTEICTIKLQENKVTLFHRSDIVYDMERDNTGW